MVFFVLYVFGSVFSALHSTQTQAKQELLSHLTNNYQDKTLVIGIIKDLYGSKESSNTYAVRLSEIDGISVNEFNLLARISTPRNITLQGGEVVQFETTFRTPKSDGFFSYQNYLLLSGVYATGYVSIWEVV